MSKKVDKNFEAFEGAVPSAHRRAPATKIKAPDNLLNKKKRKTTNATLLELESNASLLGWMIRRHVDYVSRFDIIFESQDKKLHNEVNNLLDWYQKKSNIDISKRHNLKDFMAIFETNKVFFGDAFIYFLPNGKLNGLDSTQICYPDSWKKETNKELMEKTTEHGLILGEYGQVTHYCVCDRNKYGKTTFNSFIPAEDVYFDGYFSLNCQTRGISPLTAIINDLTDLNEINLFNKINIKLKNMFGIAVYKNDDTFGGNSEYEEGSPTAIQQQQEITPDRINILDMNTDERVEFLESNSPGVNTMEYMEKLARFILLSLDLPYTSYNSRGTTFSARIADRAEYEESVERKREKNKEAIQEIVSRFLRYQYKFNIDFKKIVDESGRKINDIIKKVYVIPASTPWLDTLNQIKGDSMMVGMGLTSIPRLAKKYGVNATEILKEQGAFLAEARDLKVPIFYSGSGQPDVTIETNNDNIENGEENELQEE